MTDPAAPPATPIRRRKRVIKYVLGGVALLLAGGVAVASLRFDSIVNALKDRQLAAVSKTLGRPVRGGKVTTHLLSLSLDVEDVSVAPDPARPAEKLPVVALRKLHVGLAGRTLWSLGKRPGLTALELEGLTVNVVKHADGTLNLQNLIDAMPPDEEPSPPMDEETKALVRQLSVQRLRLGDARVHFFDLGRAGATVDVTQLELAADDAALDRPTTVRFGAALLSPRKNLTLAVRLGAAPPSLEGGPPLEHLTVKIERTDLAPLAPFLAALPALAGLETATLALDADLGRSTPGGPALFKGDLAMTGVRFGPGQPFDVTLASDVSVLPAPRGGGTVDIRRLSLGIAAMAVEARGRVEALDTPRFSGFQVQSKGLDFDRLRLLLPDLDRRAGAVLHGPFSLSAKADGTAQAQRFEAALDLSPASIAIPQVLAKAAGVPLRLEARGTAENDGVKLEQLGLQVADWRLAASGTARGLSRPEPALAFTAEAQAPGLDGLLRLLPPVAEALGPGAKTDGQLAIKARLDGTPTNLHAQAEVQLARLAVRVPGVRLGGGGSINLVADRKERSLDATLKADFTALEAFYLDLIRKRPGVPLSLEALVNQAGATQKVRFNLRAAELRAEGRVELTPAGKDQALVAELTVPPFRTGSLTAMLPGLVDTPLADMRAGAKVQARGRLGAPATIKLVVEDLSLTAGKSDLHGKLTVANLERPRVDLEARSSYLDVDDFLPPAAGARPAPAPPPAAPAKQAPPPHTTGRARLNVARGRAGGLDYEDLRADLDLAGGRAVAKTLEVGIFGGHFSGTGTQLDLFDDRQPFTAKGMLTQIDTDKVITHYLGISGLVVGRLSSTVELGGAGTAPSLLEKSLEGFLEGGLQQAQLFGNDFLPSLLAPVIAKVNTLPHADKLLDLANPAFRKFNDRALAEVRTGLQIAKGAINLSKPVTFETTSGPVKLDGRVLIGGRWDMSGVLSLSPEAATALTGQRLKIDRPVPIKLAVTGPLAHPRVAPTALDEVVRVYATAFAGSALQSELGRRAQGALADRLPPAAQGTSPDEARAKAEAAAAEARARSEAEARVRVEAERSRLEAEARTRADEAKRAAAEKAKDKLRGLLGR
jgi:hypothetical protein